MVFATSTAGAHSSKGMAPFDCADIVSKSSPTSPDYYYLAPTISPLHPHTIALAHVHSHAHARGHDSLLAGITGRWVMMQVAHESIHNLSYQYEFL
jgi:hypothetical protein